MTKDQIDVPAEGAEDDDRGPTFEVIATAVGAKASGLVKPGTRFEVTYGQYSPNWMRPVDAKARRKMAKLADEQAEFRARVAQAEIDREAELDKRDAELEKREAELDAREKTLAAKEKATAAKT